MNRKFFILSVFALIVAINGFFFAGRQINKEETKPVSAAGTEFALSAEVEGVLIEKSAMITEFLRDPMIIEGAKKSNEQNKSLLIDDILMLDAKWRDADPEDDFVNLFSTNEIAMKLIEFQQDNDGFRDIFVTDAHGLIVGQTNKTTDCYQADEDWWIYSYNNGEGESLHGLIEFDESAQAQAVAVYVPVMDPETDKAIGVAKAVIDILTIEKELEYT
jgi:hypothetical protein